MRRFFLLAFAPLALTACPTVLGFNRPTPQPDAAGAWTAALRAAAALAEDGRYAAADSVLAAFEAAHSGTQHARETAFWRALYRIDPRNRAATRASGIAALDIYLRSNDLWWYRREAEVVRLLARAGEPLPAPPPATARDTSLAAKDQEIRQLRDRVAELTAELDRIKRRLASPQR